MNEFNFKSSIGTASMNLLQHYFELKNQSILIVQLK